VPRPKREGQNGAPLGLWWSLRPFREGLSPLPAKMIRLSFVRLFDMQTCKLFAECNPLLTAYCALHSLADRAEAIIAQRRVLSGVCRYRLDSIRLYGYHAVQCSAVQCSAVSEMNNGGVMLGRPLLKPRACM
jgi:hypothetical protein